MIAVTNGLMPIIVATRREFIAVLDDYVFCQLCDRECDVFEEMYYIPVLGVVFCKECKDLYCESAVMYRVDAKTADFNFDKMKSAFIDLDVWDDSGVAQ